jgi:hypothetical protein
MSSLPPPIDETPLPIHPVYAPLLQTARTPEDFPSGHHPTAMLISISAGLMMSLLIFYLFVYRKKTN